MSCQPPDISVIMPCYNVGPYLRECLDSVIGQTSVTMEIICVNDGSTDDTPDILAAYAARDARIQVISKANTGYGHSMNTGMDAAKGKYIAIVETDDYLLPAMYKTLYRIAKSHELDFIKSDYYRFYGDGRRRTAKRAAITTNRAYYSTVLNPSLDPLLLNINQLNQTGIFKRSFLTGHGIRFNETSGASFQDNGFWFQTFCLGERAYFLPRAFYMLRRDNPHSSVNDKAKVYCICDEYDYIRAFLAKHPELETRFLPMYHKKKLDNYLFSYNRIADVYKTPFLQRMKTEFARAQAGGELDLSLLPAKDRERLAQIINDPEAYRATASAPEKKGMIASKTAKRFNIRRLNARISRTFLKAIRIFREQGAGYTISRIMARLNARQMPQADPRAAYYSTMDPQKYPRILCRWYKSKTGKKLDLTHPKTYNEKVQWFKLYGVTPLHKLLSDKYLVRDWVEQRIGLGYLVPLLGVWDKAEDIDFDRLPEKFVLKANHGCGYNLIVKNKETLNRRFAVTKANSWLLRDFAFSTGFEMQYHGITRKLVAEAYLENGDGDLYDYKVWCFQGRAVFIMFLMNRKEGLQMSFYDREWNLTPVSYDYPRCEKAIPRPDNLDELLAAAEKLAAGFPHVRVDFYRMDDGRLYFGEMTFTPFSGVCRWEPPEYDRILGDMFVIPSPDNTRP
jgi:glycosyltransferase involved in cell wall biosynthesis